MSRTTLLGKCTVRHQVLKAVRIPDTSVARSLFSRVRDVLMKASVTLPESVVHKQFARPIMAIRRIFATTLRSNSFVRRPGVVLLEGLMVVIAVCHYWGLASSGTIACKDWI